jgi:phosphoribosylformimino-5-aminoimidazole carboxamide ribotide isomerase
MNLYPAIDIYKGNAVRLRQGRREEATVYGSPLDMARRWVGAGARWLHIVDLDGAFEGRPRSTEAIGRIRSECEGVRIQTGGGIRNMSAVEALIRCGVDRVILGTAAVEDPEFLRQAVDRFGEQIAAGIDARDQTVRLAGWTTSASITAIELASKLERAGISLVVYTDISRDGEMRGINVDANRKMLEATGLKVIASGGVSSMKDLTDLTGLNHPRLDGAIIGKALYEEKIHLEEALSHVG